MTIECNNDEVIPTSNESSCEERASEEEIDLEETEEELRSELITYTPQDDRPHPDDLQIFHAVNIAQIASGLIVPEWVEDLKFH
jgi:hypothetical protein